MKDDSAKGGITLFAGIVHFKEVDGCWICQSCGYEYSGMMGDDEVPEFCEVCYEDKEEARDEGHIKN